MLKKSHLFRELTVVPALGFVFLMLFSHAFPQEHSPTPDSFDLIGCGYLYVKSIPSAVGIERAERLLTAEDGSTYKVYYSWGMGNVVDIWGDDGSSVTQVSQYDGTIKVEKLREQEMLGAVDIYETGGCVYVARFSSGPTYDRNDPILIAPYSVSPSDAVFPHCRDSEVISLYVSLPATSRMQSPLCISIDPPPTCEPRCDELIGIVAAYDLD